MRITTEKVPIAWELQLTIRALHPEWVQLQGVIQDNITFYPDLKPLLKELNLAIDGWSAPIIGPCGYEEAVLTRDALRDKLRESIDKNTQLGLR